MMFATSQTYFGDLGGVEGADVTCGRHAEAAGLPGTWRAWLSVPDDPVGDRLDLTGGPLVTVDGVLIAQTREDLLRSELAGAVAADEFGRSVSHDIWTGTRADGSVSAVHCSSFSSVDTMEIGLCGSPSARDGRWTENTTPRCDTPLGLYCLEQ